MKKDLGIYIHIPFCVRKCPYCGFLSAPPETEDAAEKYIDYLVEEIVMTGGAYGKGRRADTVFIGGGTPSILQPGQISRVVNAVREGFEMTSDPEMTIEANPGTLTREKLKEYRECGINRLSMGVQSMDDGLLESLGRIHRSDDVIESFKLARDVGFDNINLDLMFGMPGQDMDIWEDTLRQITDLDPEHVSFYSLQIEENTPFYASYKEGRLDTATDEMEREMHHRAIHMLEDAGYRHYEISNSAKPGYECRHNLKYWSMKEYLGLGLGAHSYLEACAGAQSDGKDDQSPGDSGNSGTGFMGGLRYNNREDMAGYFYSIGCGRLPVEPASVSRDTEKDAAGIYIFTALRKRAGIDLNDFYGRFGKSIYEAFPGMESFFDEWETEGLVEIDKERFKLTEKGIDKSNDIMSEFV